MQAHSMTALAVANNVFGFHYGAKIPKSADVEIEFKNVLGETKHIFQSVSQIEPIGQVPYITGLRVGVKTTYGEQCTITVKRRTVGEFKQGEELVATHSVQHRAGLEEHYVPSRQHLYGYHRNSLKYGDFGGDVSHESFFILYCDVWDPEKRRFKSIDYKVKFKPHY